MNSDELSRVISQYVSDYYLNIARAVDSNQIAPSPKRPFYYPSHLLVIESAEHYVIEIIGYRSDFTNGLSVRKRQIKSTVDHFDQFGTRDGKPALAVNTGYLTLEGIVLCRADENERLTSRFPVLRGFGQRYRLSRTDGSGSLITFGADVQACVLKNCYFVNAKNGVYRLKVLNYAMVLSKQITPQSMLELLRREFPQGSVHGVIEPEDEYAMAVLVAGQLQSLYLSPTVHETTIGAFLSAHPQIITASLGSTSHIYEPLLAWVHDPPDGRETQINPDMLVRRDDGFWDIVDFKTAALDRLRLTKGGHNRRRFVDYVYEGIAQLANYANYFEFPENVRYAEKKYGIHICAPNLFLIVGSMENCDLTQVSEALRAHTSVSIIDYDTIVQTYLAAARKRTE